MNKVFKRISAVTLGLTMILSLAACGKTAPSTSEGQASAVSSAGNTKKIRFAYKSTGNWPVTGNDTSGNPDGYDIEVLKLVDEALPDYEFEYIGTSYEDAYVGLEAGNFDAVLTNAFWTEERAEKYLIPEENIGASVLILAVRKENEGIKSFSDFADSGLKLAPILAGNGMYYVVKQYNEANPDKQIEITTTDNATFVAGTVEELVAGKYDATIETKPAFDTNFVAEDGVNHIFFNDVAYTEFDTAKTYPLFNKNVGEEAVKAISDAIKTVKDSGKASEISEEFFGYDIFNYNFG